MYVYYHYGYKTFFVYKTVINNVTARVLLENHIKINLKLKYDQFYFNIRSINII